MAWRVPIEPVGEQCVKLQPQQPSLGQQGAVLLNLREEVGDEVGLGEHHRLPEQGAYFGAADVKDIAQLC